MLRFIRRKSQSIVVQGIVLVIAIVFILWGGSRNLGSNYNSAVTVNGKKVSLKEYDQAYKREAERLRQQFGGQIPKGLLEQLNLKGQVIENLVQRELIRQAGEKMGLEVAPEAVAREVMQAEYFKKDGQFDKELYEKVLRSNNLTPSMYEKGIREDLTIRQVVNNVNSFAVLPDSEIKLWQNLLGEKIKLAVLSFKSKDFEDKVVVDDDILAPWYEKRKSQYAAGKKVKLKYLVFTGEDGAGKKDKNKAFAEVSQAFEDIMNIGSLDKYAQEKNIDIKISDYLSRDEIVSELPSGVALADAAFKLNKGELSSTIELADGYAIIFVDDIKESAPPALAEVRDRVEADFRREKAVDLARATAIKKLAESKEGGKIEGDGLIETDYISRSDPQAEGVPRSLITKALSMAYDEKFPESPLEVGDEFYIYELTDRWHGSKELSDAERKQLQQQLLSAEKNRLFKDLLSSMRAEAKIKVNEALLN